MSRRQFVMVILINALISLLISLGVMWFGPSPWASKQPTYAPLVMPPGAAQPTPPKTDVVYVVQQGDSLSGIAARFGVPIADLMLANDLSDANRISVGQRLIIPAGPVTARPPTRQPSPTLTTLPFEAPTPVAIPTMTPAGPPTAATPETTATSTSAPTAS